MGGDLNNINYEQLTPVMVQYMKIKDEYKDCILFYRLGDFYEMFFDDALLVSKELELTLTGKSCGLEERAPMCGVPFHASEGYITKLVENGHKVAICEQVEDPALAKGLVKREVIRVVTPGTNINPQALDESRNNYLAGVYYCDDMYGMAALDVSTGDFFIQELETLTKINDEIYKLSPAELICNEAFLISGLDFETIKEKLKVSVGTVGPDYFDSVKCEKVLANHFKKKDCSELGINIYPAAKAAAGAVLRYALETQMISLDHVTTIVPYVSGKYMIIDSQTRRNLELTETMRDKNRVGSLLHVLDKTGTAMGARMLRSFVEQPLLEKDEIEKRLDSIEELNNNVFNREEIREYLNSIYDLERLAGRISYRNANPRDMIAFASSAGFISPIKTVLGEFKSSLLKSLYDEIDTLSDLKKVIDETITDEPPINIREGGIIRDGFSTKIDELRSAKTEGKSWLAELEASEREKTGIKNLRIKYSRVFGYCLEVTSMYKNMVPENWIRKQTLAQAERYTTPELKELEDKILNAEDRLMSLEYEMFTELREKVADNIVRIQKTAKKIAMVDCLCSLSYVAERNGYVRPTLNENGTINIKGGRHPVVERVLKGTDFVANDTYLNDSESRIAIITGPNMAGKSTYMRQTALIVLMAQMGSFVPADSADIGLVDRVFTRVGASDDLASGQSTFMVEMNEVSQIMTNATSKSLLILDEIGRGTSTFDGLAIAWAVVEYIADSSKIGAKTLFATHYHELTELEERLDCVKNFSIAVKEQGEDIIFLRKIVNGGADKSYGIQVARLAGLPEDILKRAKEIVEVLSLNDINSHDRSEMIKTGGNVADKYRTAKPKKKNEMEMNQLSFFAERKHDNILDDIRELDIMSLTPIQALNKLAELQEELRQ
ncbi:MAG: DNA mismatch repair protein MutS [Lachnospiraceae bacterium]|nr:DNA mismatch repair protein MutS [Lachnospiraceae bacterium]